MNEGYVQEHIYLPIFTMSKQEFEDEIINIIVICLCVLLIKNILNMKLKIMDACSFLILFND